MAALVQVGIGQGDLVVHIGIGSIGPGNQSHCRLQTGGERYCCVVEFISLHYTSNNAQTSKWSEEDNDSLNLVMEMF